ncbi:Major facilitator superfamily domain, general substrate transporter [Cordyceps fumosorosea ARSEF 2679]|uniref:Major facilitator superfamily domain, general substrate transporter n=1 Tax=Cordyceps fumosorosea (strain ARSEF 2679) TaxID=1081104 RepID=A0A167VZQ5_CORFA|nr:Major facilitator superfamily domain, general substrate transporter [Cordyceps fumosorosea ARSEF 2679]OAA63155.1 Major facilitator superfamily domain, general substrate transporter [Cordyceps fumosorosea ARSEF 2679]
MSTTEPVPSTPTRPDGDAQEGAPGAASPPGTGLSVPASSDASEKQLDKTSAAVEWDLDPRNPMNWPNWKKAHLIIMLSSFGFVSSAGTSIISPATAAIAAEFHVSRVVALLPLSLYCFALGFGPVLGGPLSETLGRRPVYVGTSVLGALFTLVAGLTHSFAGLCVLRFLAGFCWAPALASGSGSIVETFAPRSRGPMMAVYILMPFLGPGFARQNWRWTQWILLFFAAFTLLFTLTTWETFPAILKRRIAKERGEHVPPSPPIPQRIATFLQTGLVRPVHMLLTEPITGFLCLYVSVNFGILFSFFAGLAYTFGRVYHFDVEQSGLVFLSVAVGCLLGLATILLCDVALYRPRMARFPGGKVPPEHRLYPAMVGSLGLPVGLFWYAWTARSDVSWASPAVAILPFAWGNLCIFVSAMQYGADTYHGSVVASQASANSLARYGFAGAFPLFIVQMYDKLGVNWAVSLFAFVTVALLPIPWVLFKFGPRIRALSKYPTVQYENL